MASPIWSITLKNCTTILLLVVVLHFGGSNGAADSTQDQSSKCSCDEALINRQGFPNGFIFGAGSSAYQTEGGFDENGKGPGMWDNYTHTYPDKILDQSNGDVAAGSYHHYKEDVRLLKNMGVDAYKFSISWPRILPGGSIRKGVNRDGIDYYNNLINKLVANGIEPWVTILHLDTPQALEDEYGGFLSTQILADFQDFADLLFSEFGDRVKYWITVNEPWALSVLGYTRGVFAPGRCSHWMEGNCATGDSAVEPYIVMHNQLLAHAATVKLYRQKYQESQKGKIGIVVNSFWLVPYDDKEENIKATARALDFMIGWNMEPITFGRYPMSMQERVGSRLPKFTEEEAELLKGSFDFLGVNYYSGSYAFDVPNTNTNQVSYLTDSESDITGVKDGVPIGEKGSTVRTYYAYPKGLRKILHYIKENYGNSLIYITENGYDEDDKPLPLALQDYKRKDYFVDHLCCLREAIEKDGANVKGFFTWSLTDNFGYMSGYLVRFGLHYVDFTNKSLRRYPKYSARWFKQILRGGIKGPESTRISDQ